jgi:cellobiose dehydrogenase (acceptor)
LSVTFTDNFTVIGAVLAQDLATHGYYTEPNTGITFYTSYEPNGTIVGDGEFSEVSWGGYTFGIALPPSALTVDSFDYIGLIVSFRTPASMNSPTKNALDRFSS